jgi:hypothetical protein
MVMKSLAQNVKSEEKPEMQIDHDEFWAEIFRVVVEKFKGTEDKEEVFAALKKGYEDKFEKR